MQKLVIITGAGSGIGRALSQQLAQRGLTILAIGRRLKPLQETAEADPEKIHILTADVSSEAGRQKIGANLPPHAKVVALVHNAGQLEPLALLQDITLAQWRSIAATNIEAPLFLTQALLPQLSGARVLHLSSGWAHIAARGAGAYCMTKAALHMLYRCWQEDLSDQDITIGSVMPGIVATDMNVILRNYSETQQISVHTAVASETAAAFITWLLLDTDRRQFSAQEWDIYDNTHHPYWLADRPVPMLNL